MRRAMPLIQLEHKYWVFLVCVIGIFITVFDTSSSIVALPTIAQEFGTDLLTAQWVIAGNGLTIAALLVPMGRLSDFIGRKRIYVIGALIFALGALFGSWSGTIYELIAARVLVGIGSAMTQAAGMAILVTSFDARERAKMLGLHSARWASGRSSAGNGRHRRRHARLACCSRSRRPRCSRSPSVRSARCAVA
jgi:MFS family permease